MRSNLPAMRRETRNNWYWARDLLVNGITVGRGGGNVSSNTAVGKEVLKYNTTGYSNTAVGNSSLRNTTTGYQNLAIGVNAGFSNTTGNSNTSIGYNSSNNITTGSGNSFFGYNAGSNQQTVSNQIGIGYEALRGGTTPASNTGTSNTAIGHQALLVNTSGGSNVAVGANTLKANTTGSANIANGTNCLISNTTGSYNVAIGISTLNNNSTGSRNTAIGFYGTLFSNTTSGYNSVIGGYTAYSQNNQTITAGSFIVGASYTILTAGTTDYTLIGSANNSVGTVFTATGVGSGTGTATLNHQTSALGYQASYSNLSGHNVTALGVNSLYSNTAFYNVTGVGANTEVTGSNQVQLGDAATTTYAYGAVQDRSDLRDKADVRDTTLGLAFIESLRPVDFKWDKREDYRTQPPGKPDYPVKPAQPERVDSLQLEGELEEDYKARVDAEWAATLDTWEEDYRTLCDTIDAEFLAIHSAWLESNKLANITHDGTHKRNRYHHGVIAQEVPAEFGGLQHHALKGGDDVWSVGYEEFIAPLIKAVQELSAENKLLKQHLGLL